MTHSCMRIASLLVLFTGIMITSCSDNKEKNAELIADTDLVLPSGFIATAVVDSLGGNRHLFVNSNGDVYVKLNRLKDGKGIIVLRDSAKSGKYVVVKSFGNYTGTGIVIKNGYLYATSDEEVFRYKMNEANEVADPDNPEKIVSGLVEEGQHESKSIALDDSGNLYVTIGAPANACQEVDRTAGSPGKDPCPLLEKTGGVWQFKADKLNQSYAEGIHYATGIRNMVGVNWNTNQNQLYGVQHGRDQFAAFYPTMYTEEQSAELPSEEFFLIKKGSDFGWPYCYYDHLQKKKVMGPEYGGDGKQTGRCEGKDLPIMGFPGHWAPNDILFYTGNLFPEKYHNGAFIAFHGSWNRAPFKQAGYCVVFVPFKNGTPSGDYEIFANGFIGKDSITGPNQAKYRPCGLAQGSDGALYISESTVGKIWKVGYKN